MQSLPSLTLPNACPHVVDSLPDTDLMQVCLHELKDNVDVLELSGARRQHDVLDLNNICDKIQSLAVAHTAVVSCS